MKQLNIHLLKKDRNLEKRFWAKVAPVLLNELIWGGGFTMYSVIMGHLEADAVAANSIAKISKNLVVRLCLGLGSGGSIIVGYELGASHFEEAKKTGRMLIICLYYFVGKSVNSMTMGGIFPAGGDSKFGLLCDTVTLWCITIPLGCFCALALKIPISHVYFILNLDEIVKLPAVYWHYKKYGWVKNITNGGFEHE